jgi:hypothetical protein
MRARADPKSKPVGGPHAPRVIGIILALVVAHAQADAYSVDDAVAYALAHNPGLGAASGAATIRSTHSPTSSTRVASIRRPTSALMH